MARSAIGRSSAKPETDDLGRKRFRLGSIRRVVRPFEQAALLAGYQSQILECSWVNSWLSTPVPSLARRRESGSCRDQDAFHLLIEPLDAQQFPEAITGLLASDLDPEVAAMAAIMRVLAPLDPAAIRRVLGYAESRFGAQSSDR